MSGLQFRVAARTDAAGKYNATAPLEGNEDNMFLDADLSNQAQGEFMADEVVNLSDKGCLMVVADGMGGMNAGEVASAIAIKTVMEYFDFEHLKDKIFRDSRSRISYMEDVVVAADAAIKADSRTNKDHEGMGSTIIMAWLCDNEICLTWCGDSRAYLYRPGRGFWQVSKDHSYVQGLVDEGKITPDEAFDHPYGNIITRSLGDPEKKAKPESVNFDVFQGDIFMLCSDGLSGVLRDHKTFVEGQRIDTENLEDIIAANRSSMAQCRDELFEAAQRNDWYDNVTAILCEVVKGKDLPANEPAPMKPVEGAGYSAAPNPVQPNSIHHSRISIRKKNIPIIIALMVLLLGVAGFLVWKFATREKDNYSLQADNTMFNECETSNQYRDYLNRYGKKGAHYREAKNTLDKMVQDSITKANNLKSAVPEQPQEKPNEPRVDKKNGYKKGENKQENIEPMKKMPTEEDWNRDNEEVKPAEPDQKLTPDNPDQGLKSEDPNQGLTSTGPNQGLKNGGLTQTTSAPPGSEEEAYQRTQQKGATIDDCCAYIERYTNRGKYVANVRNTFRQLYAKKFGSCKTYDDYKKFLDEHEVIMKRMGLKGSDAYDTPWRNRAEAKMNELRPQPGAQSAPNNKPKPQAVHPQ